LKQRVDPAATSGEDGEFWMATVLMTGLRFPWSLIEDWFRGITAMRQSSAYEHFVSEGRVQGLKEGLQEGVRKGHLEEARETLLRQGQIRFGPPDQKTEDALESVTDLKQLKSLLDRVITAHSWSDLVATVSTAGPEGNQE
jgi:predicted transposase YdaD